MTPHHNLADVVGMPTATISFDCTPLRSVARWDGDWDEQPAGGQGFRMRRAAAWHGAHNTYYLSAGSCELPLSAAPGAAPLRFAFEGTVFTDWMDQRCVAADLAVWAVDAETPRPQADLPEALVDTLRRSIMAEFDRYIASCDRDRALERIRQTEQAWLACGGYLGMGL